MNELIILLDASGSMEVRLKDIQDAINELKNLNKHTLITLVEFNSTVKPIYTAIQGSEMPYYKFLPGGQTALYDAIVQTFTHQAHRIQDEGVAKRVKVCIFSDGDDNRSQATIHEAKEMIEQAQLGGWEIEFFGLDLNDNIGQRLGVNPLYIKNINKVGDTILQIGNNL